MKAYSNFKLNVDKLLSFYRATLYSYEQTENLLKMWREKKLKFNKPTEYGLTVNLSRDFKLKKMKLEDIRKYLLEIVFVRLVSALEVYFVDVVREAFLKNKEPFKVQDKTSVFTHSELLSITTLADIYNKIINSECRKLTNGGLNDIAKYYKKHFNVDIKSFAPGYNKIEEYHDRRHLLVHRLGKTDKQFREKYNFKNQTVTVDESYLFECIKDFRSFSSMIDNQITNKLENEYNKKSKKVVENIIIFEVELKKTQKPEIFDPKYEFWAGDEFLAFENLLDEEKFSDNIYEYKLSGSINQIESYKKILKRSQKANEIILRYKNDFILFSDNKFKPKIIDEELINAVKQKLPVQPWPKGTHKKIASELGITNKTVSTIIHILIEKGIFKHQFYGNIIENTAEKV